MRGCGGSSRATDHAARYTAPIRSAIVLALPLLVLLPTTACEVRVNDVESMSAPPPPPTLPELSPIPGWSVEGHARGLYAAEVDGGVVREGHPTVRFHPTQETGGGYATYMTTLDAKAFRGRRAHAIVFVRSQGVTARGDAWLRVQGADSPTDGPGLAASITHLAANADFTRYELSVDVPVEAVSLQLGVGLAGPGMLWMDGVKVEAL
jgi:hypothetical protein